MIRVAKFALLALAAGWAVYSLWGLWAVSQIFRSVPQEHIPPLDNFLSGLQLFAVTLGPLVLATAFLLIWPRAPEISN